MILLRVSYDEYDEHDEQGNEENNRQERQDIGLVENDDDGDDAVVRSVVMNRSVPNKRIARVRPYIRMRTNWVVFFLKIQVFVIPLAVLILTSAILSDQFSFMTHRIRTELDSLQSDNQRVLNELEQTLQKIDFLKEALNSVKNEIGVY